MTSTLDPDKLRRRAGQILGKADRTSDRLVKAVRVARAKLDAINANQRLAPEAKAEDRRAAEAELRAAVDKAEEAGLAAVAEAEQLIERATKRDERDTSAALLAEQRLGRVWARTEKLLNADVDPVKVAQEAAQAGDRDTLAALRAELPGHLQAKGRSGEVDGMLIAIDHAETPLRSPLDEAAREIRDQASRRAHAVRAAAATVRHDGFDTEVVPTSDGVVPVAEEGK